MAKKTKPKKLPAFPPSCSINQGEPLDVIARAPPPHGIPQRHAENADPKGESHGFAIARKPIVVDQFILTDRTAKSPR
ncbi:hypothetical protein [Pendulispora rubella]|uniref:hypothetical protein n=1 Tax=Pendulispora rubella TaxID=2741070 RepID=UPI0030DFAD15